MTATITEHVMKVLDHTGDTRTIWDPTVQAEVDAARAQFETLRGKGYMAYRVNNEGGEAEQIREFDSTAGRIILRPQLVGG